MSFYGSARDTIGQSALRALYDWREAIDDDKVSFFCVCSDLKDKAELSVDQKFPKLQFIWDINSTVNRAYGVGSGRMWIILDPMLRVMEVVPFRTDGTDVSKFRPCWRDCLRPRYISGLKVMLRS